MTLSLTPSGNVNLFPMALGPPETFRRRSKSRKHRITRHKKAADEIYDLQMREAVLRWTRAGLPDSDIAQRLGQSIPRIKRYREDAIRRATQRALDRAKTGPVLDLSSGCSCLPPPRSKDSPRTPTSGWGPVSGQRRLSPPRSTYVPPGVSGEILDPPEVVQLRKDCLQLRKAMVPFDQMADLLGVSEQECRKRAAEALREIELSEHANADLERRLMIEQLDQMIAGIHAPATGRKLDGSPTMIDLGAIDRMLKLMKQKADLLGLSAPPAVDIRIRLQALADEGGYDIVDLEEIARDVLLAHKLKLPEFR